MGRRGPRCQLATSPVYGEEYVVHPHVEHHRSRHDNWLHCLTSKGWGRGHLVGTYNLQEQPLTASGLLRFANGRNT